MRSASEFAYLRPSESRGLNEQEVIRSEDSRITTIGYSSIIYCVLHIVIIVYAANLYGLIVIIFLFVL